MSRVADLAPDITLIANEFSGEPRAPRFLSSTPERVEIIALLTVTKFYVDIRNSLSRTFFFNASDVQLILVGLILENVVPFEMD